jgi:hypothetical protein
MGNKDAQIVILAMDREWADHTFRGTAEREREREWASMVIRDERPITGDRSPLGSDRTLDATYRRQS